MEFRNEALAKFAKFRVSSLALHLPLREVVELSPADVTLSRTSQGEELDIEKFQLRKSLARSRM
jgi:hypothetical protein